MPYTISNPPDKIKDMPKHAQEIWISAFNNAIKQYDGDEERANKVAYAAVKQKYEQDKSGKWMAKESEVSMKNKSSEAVHPHGNHECICSECGHKIMVEANAECKEQKCPECGGAMVAVTAGERRGVKESLQQKYSTILQELGKRNAAADSARIKKIVELCQELLASEEADEESIKKADKEAGQVLAWLKEQAAMKTDGGVKFPAAAYAYVPDPEKPSTWKLRIWEDPEKKVTRVQLGRAAAALSPGGFRGQRVEIPASDLATVKRKIRAEYRKLDVEDEDIPRWVKESESRHLLHNYVSLEEATVDSKGIAKVIVIKPGFGNPVDNHYYPEETLARDYPVFEGAKMYSDHQTEEEEKQRPEGSIRQWVASLKNVRFEEGVGIVGDAMIIEPWLQQKLAMLREKKLLSEMGISIRAAGTGTKGKIDGKDANIVERITRVRSVDFVTEAGAGGGVLLYETERDFDIDIVSLSVLKERRPDLIKSIETEVKEKTMKEVKKAMEIEEELKDTKEQLETVTKERDEAVDKLSESDKAKRIAEAKSVIDDAISKAELPEAAKERLTERFKDAESADGIEDAIQTEKDYVDALSEASKPKNLGGSQPNPEEDKKALRESFKKLHPDWSEEQLDAAVEGR